MQTQHYFLSYHLVNLITLSIRVLFKVATIENRGVLFMLPDFSMTNKILQKKIFLSNWQ